MKEIFLVVGLACMTVLLCFGLAGVVVFGTMWLGQVECDHEPSKPLWCREVAR